MDDAKHFTPTGFTLVNQANRNNSVESLPVVDSPQMVQSRIRQLIEQGDIVVSKAFRELYCS